MTTRDGRDGDGGEADADGNVAADGGVEAAREPDRPPTDDAPDRGERDAAGGGGDAATRDAALVGEDLVVAYPAGEEPVIDGATVRIPEGALTALVGPNGSGKSTLLKALADRLPPEEGVVHIGGDAVADLGAKERARRLGLLDQENAAPDGVTVEDLVAHGRYPHRGFFDPLDADDRAAIDRAIRLAGVDHLRGRAIESLSGGQRQLVWIAMALAQDTDVLLLDEPTTFLDLHHQLEVMEIVETLRSESDVTVVVVLHDVQQAARSADRVVALKDGAIHASGAPEEVVTEELLAEVFRIDAEVAWTERGPRIVPLRPRHDDATDGGHADPGDG